MRSEWKRNKTYAMVQTDRFEQALIQGLEDLYRDAGRDVAKLADAFGRQHANADARMRALLDEGKITEEYYRSWRNVQMGRGKRWEAMKAQMADRLNNADKMAAEYINSRTPSIYALNHDYTCFQIDQAGMMEGGSFTLANEEAIRELVIGGNHVNFRTMRPDPVRNYNWNAQRVQRTLAVGLLSGKSVQKIATDFQRLTGSNRKAAERNARTAVTSAQNAGTQAAFDEAKGMGIQLKKEWMCTHDDRTRESHVDLDGQRVDNDKPFGNGLMYPGDPSGAPAEVYNCRCTMRGVLPYMEKNEKEQEKVYTQWKDEQTDIEPQDRPRYAYVPPKEDTEKKKKKKLVKRIDDDNRLYDASGEYKKLAKKRKNGEIVYDDRYQSKNHGDEIRMAQWLSDKYGGIVRLLSESVQVGVKTSDYIWNDRDWELKGITSINSADKNLQKALTQLSKNPGGVILELKNQEADMKGIENAIKRRLIRSNVSADVMIVDGEKTKKVIRYIRKEIPGEKRQ